MDALVNDAENSELVRSIAHTVKTLARIEESIKRHQSKSAPDQLAIEQWHEVKADLTRQLVEMLSQIGVELRVSEQLAAPA